MGKREWQQFADHFYSVPNLFVFHVCHTEDAIRIFEDGEIRPSLICDESKLRTTRTSVSWLSPNNWVNGFRYGNVAFKFDWKRVIEGKRLYWVEPMMSYRPPAFRILITENEPVIPLETYRAERGDGPLLHDVAGDVWTRNGRYTAEFMFDGALPLSECVATLFVDHHSGMCSKTPACNDLGKSGRRCGARLLARLIAEPNNRHVRRLFREEKPTRLRGNAAEAWNHLIRSLSVEKAKAGRIRSEHSAASNLASVILYRFSTHRKTAALCNLFRNTHELRQAIRERAMRILGIRSLEGLSLLKRR
jgi:hypothetical protein